jgi:hypothetical protein
LDDFAEHTDNAVLELLEVGLQNAGSLGVIHVDSAWDFEDVLRVVDSQRCEGAAVVL